jgi:hypothetical protein
MIKPAETLETENGDCTFMILDGQFRLICNITDKDMQSAFSLMIATNQSLKPLEIARKTFGESYEDDLNYVTDGLNALASLVKTPIDLSKETIDALFVSFYTFLLFREQVLGLKEPPKIVFAQPKKEKTTLDEVVEKLVATKARDLLKNMPSA